MKKVIKKLNKALSVVLVAAMVVTLLPTNMLVSNAEELTDEDETVVEQTVEDTEEPVAENDVDAEDKESDDDAKDDVKEDTSKDKGDTSIEEIVDVEVNNAGKEEPVEEAEEEDIDKENEVDIYLKFDDISDITYNTEYTITAKVYSDETCNTDITSTYTSAGGNIVYTYSTAEDGTYNSTKPVNVGDYYVKASASAVAGSYNETTKTVSFKIVAKAEDQPGTPTAGSTDATADTIYFKTTDGLKYAVSVNSTAPTSSEDYSIEGDGSEKSASAVTTTGTADLTADTDYYVYAIKPASDGNHKDSAHQQA